LKNYYAALGVNKTASQDEIKKAYRNLSKQYHPDVNPDGEARFKDVAEAYETLGDPAKRAQYDNPRPSQPNFDPFANFNDFSFGRVMDTSHLNVQVDKRFSLAELISGVDFVLDYKISKSGMSAGSMEDRSVRVKIDLTQNEYPFTKVGQSDAIVLRVRGGGSSQVFERNDFFGRPVQASTAGDLVIRVIVDTLGVQISGADLVQKVEIGLHEALFSKEIILENPLGKRYKITSINSNNLTDIKVRVPDQGLMTQAGARGAYIFDIRVVKPDLTKLSQKDYNALNKILARI
jgi:DnaJ-class molecular chaperone